MFKEYGKIYNSYGFGEYFWAYRILETAKNDDVERFLREAVKAGRRLTSHAFKIILIYCDEGRREISVTKRRIFDTGIPVNFSI